MKIAFFGLRERLSENLWLIPSLSLACAYALSYIIPRAEEQLGLRSDYWFIEPISADSARSLLSTISASLITFTGVVFSITMLVLQLASSQLSPRMMRTFMRDRSTQVVLGVFVGSFTYALLTLRGLDSAGIDGQFQSLSVWFSVILLVTSMFCFIYYIHHIANSIRPEVLIRRIANETSTVIDRVFPEATSAEAPALPSAHPTRVISHPGRSGVVVNIDVDRLAAIAAANDCVFEVVTAPGTFLPLRGEAIRVWGNHRDRDTSQILATITLDKGRTMSQDVAFGFRQLVDVAERALSPGTNDPTTAIQVLDELHHLLVVLIDRPIYPIQSVEIDGVTRVLLHVPSWEKLVGLALDEIRLYGQRSIQVVRRQRVLIEGLLTLAPPGKDEPLLQRLALLDEVIEREFQSGIEQTIARTSLFQ